MMLSSIVKARWRQPYVAVAMAFAVILFAARAVDAEAPNPLNRWAVLASQNVRESGLPDLLTARLSQLGDVELVEREQVDLIARELEVSTLLGAESGKRLELGRRMRADALLLLTRSRGERELRVVICECRQGVRLGLMEFPSGMSQPDELADHLTQQVAEVKKRFGGGIRLIVGVTPFLSENLEHDFDHLQSRWSNLLGDRLSLEPGVAVIEVEEARAILQEQPAASQPLDRVSPFVVNGRFHVTRNTDGEPLVKIGVEVSSGEAVRKLPEKTLPLEQAAAWIVTDLTTRLLAVRDDKLVPLSAERQKEILTARADVFSRLGDWRRSSGLREAALVLDTANDAQRARLLDDYQQQFGRDFDRLWSFKKVARSERLRLFRETADRYVSAIAHLELLVRNQRISRDDALALFRRQSWQGALNFYNGDLLTDLPAAEQVPMARVLDAEKQLIITLFPKIIALPKKTELDGVIDQPRFSQPWAETLLRRVLKHVHIHHRDAPSLEFLEYVITRMLPNDDPTFWEMQLFLRHHKSPTPEDGKRYDDWIAFLKRLARSEHETARLYGRLGLFQQSIRRAGDLYTADDDTLRALIAEADGIAGDFSRTRPASDGVFHSLKVFKSTFLYHIDPALAPDSPSEPRVESLGRLRVEPIPLVVAGSGDSAAAPLRATTFCGMLNCDDQFDLYWADNGKLYVMQQAGVLRELPLAGEYGWTQYDAPARTSQVAWDGELIWLGKRGYRLDAMLPDGTHVATVDGEAGLPGSEKGLRIMAIAPRKILAVGSFGEFSRAWCAVVEVGDDNRPRVNVFHEARGVVGNDIKLDKQVSLDPRNVFIPDWICRFEAADGDPCALVGRFPVSESNGQPLRINLHTLEVDVFPRYVQGSCDNDAFFSRNGHFVQGCASFVAHYRPIDDDQASRQAQRLCGWKHDGPYKTHNLFRQIVPYQGWLYIPGTMWFRIHQETFTEERLCETILPQPVRGMRFGVSAHYGLVGRRRFLGPKEPDAPVLFAITTVDGSK